MSDDTTAQALNLASIRRIADELSDEADRSNDYIPAALCALLDEDAALRAALAERDATIARVRALHQPGSPGHDAVLWPCLTARVLDGTP